MKSHNELSNNTHEQGEQSLHKKVTKNDAELETTTTLVRIIEIYFILPILISNFSISAIQLEWAQKFYSFLRI